MNWLANRRREIVGFFVDDAFLGLGAVGAVLAAALCRLILPGRPLAAGAILAGGCLLALVLSVARAVAVRPR
jgi:hypothetical protein